MPESDYTVIQVPVEAITDGLTETRFIQPDQGIEELAQSVRTLGLLQPLVVIHHGDTYRIVAGRRRLKAVRLLHWTTVPCHVLDCQEDEELGATFAENFHRAGLNPLEEAVALAQIQKDLYYTQDQLAASLAVSRTWVSHRLSLLELDEPLMTAVGQGDVSPSIALELNRIPDDEERERYLTMVISNGATLSVVRGWVRAWLDYHNAPTGQPAGTPPTSLPTPVPPLPQPHCFVCGALSQQTQLLNVYLCWRCKTALEEEAKGPDAGGS